MPGAVWSPTAEDRTGQAAPRRRPSPPNTRIWAAALSMIAKDSLAVAGGDLTQPASSITVSERPGRGQFVQ